MATYMNNRPIDYKNFGFGPEFLPYGGREEVQRMPDLFSPRRFAGPPSETPTSTMTAMSPSGQAPRDWVSWNPEPLASGTTSWLSRALTPFDDPKRDPLRARLDAESTRIAEENEAKSKAAAEAHRQRLISGTYDLSPEEYNALSDYDKNLYNYNRAYNRMGLDVAKAKSNLRYAPIWGSLYEMLNKDNLIDPNPYQAQYENTLARSRVSADPSMPMVRYDRMNPMADANRITSQGAMAMRGMAQAYGNRPGMAAAGLANLFTATNTAAGEAYQKANSVNTEIDMQQDNANFQRMSDYLKRRAEAAQINSSLETHFGDAINEMRQKVDNANMQTKFGNRQNFYKNLGLLGQDEDNKYRAGITALNGTESAGKNSGLWGALNNFIGNKTNG